MEKINASFTKKNGTTKKAKSYNLNEQEINTLCTMRSRKIGNHTLCQT